MIKLLLIPLIGIANRVRGADFKLWKVPLTAVAKIFVAFAIAWCLGLAWWQYPIVFGLYLLGLSVGWGKWVGTLIDGKINEYKGGFDINAIHWLAKRFYDEGINYCRVALIIRGVVMWLPVLAFATFTNTLALLYLVPLAVCFPLSFEAAKKVKFHIPYIMGRSKIEGENIWQRAEVLYGILIGALFAL